jgi:hypothetical protein
LVMLSQSMKFGRSAKCAGTVMLVNKRP